MIDVSLKSLYGRLRLGVVVFAGLAVSNVVLLPYVVFVEQFSSRILSGFSGGLLLASMLFLTVLTLFVYIVVYGVVFGFMFSRIDGLSGSELEEFSLS